MPKPLDPQTKNHLASRVKYYKEMGIHDFYRRAVEEGAELALQPVAEAMPVESDSPAALPPVINDKLTALKLIRADIGDCTRCRLHKGRTNLVFGVGNVNADLMVVGEGPGADEDAQGEPFVGRAGKLLDEMLKAIGRSRQKDTFIANVVKCRPPNNREPAEDEADACRSYLEQQLRYVQPRLILALGRVATAARDRSD